MAGVSCNVDGHVAVLSFANPAQRGALTPEMLRSLRSELTALEERFPRVRVVVLRGAGDVFSSGYAIDRIPPPDQLPVKDEIEELCEAIESSTLVVVAMLRGVAVGAGLDVAAACDLRLAERHCRLGITPARLGLVYTVPGVARLHRLVGPDAARLLLYTGDLLSAEEAARIGLVTSVHDGADIERETMSLAHRIADRAPLSLAGSKQILRALETAAQIPEPVREQLHDLRRRALASPDAAEARRAFQEKRTPHFTGEAPAWHS